MNFVPLAGWLAGWSLCVADFCQFSTAAIRKSPIFKRKNRRRRVSQLRPNSGPLSKWIRTPYPLRKTANSGPPFFDIFKRGRVLPHVSLLKFSKMFSKIIRGEILESALHRMPESLKMFDFCGRKRRSTYTLTIGRGKTLSKKK